MKPKQSTHIHKIERRSKANHHTLTHRGAHVDNKDKKTEEIQKNEIEGQNPSKLRQEDGGECCLLPFTRLQASEGATSACRHQEEIDVGMQLAVEKEQELRMLRGQLEEKDELIAKLYSQAFILHKKMLAKDDALLQMEGQIIRLTNNNQSKQLPSQKRTLPQHRGGGRPREEGSEDSNIFIENIMIQNQKCKKESQSYQQAKMANQLAIEAMTEQTDSMKKAINNYDWKLFCLETELQLARNKLKEDLDGKDRQIREYQAQVQSLNSKLIAQEEELRLFTEENNFFEMQISQKQLKIQELLTEIDLLKNNEDNQQRKELIYSNQEKDQELKEMAKFLKEKISENHSLKVKCTQLESIREELEKKKEKVEFENQYLQQRFNQHEQSIQKQSQQIQADQLQIANLTSFSKAHLLRAQELQKQMQITQEIIYEQEQKMNEWNEERSCLQRKLQQTTSQLNALGSRFKNLAESYQIEVSHLNMLIVTKDKQIEKIVRTMEGQEVNIKGKDKTIQILKSEIKTIRTELKEVRFISQKYQEELQEMQEIIAVNEQKLKILKRETVGSIESEVNYELQLENAQRNVLSLELENKALQARHNSREEIISRLKKQANELRKLMLTKTEEITSFLEEDQVEEQETTTFEILADDESYEIPLTPLQKQKNELKAKIADLCSRFQGICSSGNSE